MLIFFVMLVLLPHTAHPPGWEVQVYLIRCLELQQRLSAEMSYKVLTIV
jgi:hypothetical protein